MAFERINVDPDQMGGVQCIRGLRFPVATIVSMIADSMTVEEILAGAIVVIDNERLRVRPLPLQP